MAQCKAEKSSAGIGQGGRVPATQPTTSAMSQLPLPSPPCFASEPVRARPRRSMRSIYPCGRAESRRVAYRTADAPNPNQITLAASFRRRPSSRRASESSPAKTVAAPACLMAPGQRRTRTTGTSSSDVPAGTVIVPTCPLRAERSSCSNKLAWDYTCESFGFRVSCSSEKKRCSNAAPSRPHQAAPGLDVRRPAPHVRLAKELAGHREARPLGRRDMTSAMN